MNKILNLVLLLLFLDNAYAWGISDFDPTNPNSGLNKGLTNLDPTNPNSGLNKGLTNLDPTNPNSGINKILPELDPTSKKNWERLLNIPCAKPFQQYTLSVSSACAIDNGFSGNGNIGQAINLLTQKGFYSPNDFNGVKFFWCTLLEGSAGGMVPAPDVILLSRNNRFQPADMLAPLIGHEMVHIKQIRNIGFDKFACQYSGELISGNGTKRNNFLEREAYEFRDQIENSMTNTTTNVNDGFIPPQNNPSTTNVGNNGFTARNSPPVCVSVDSRAGWQRFNLSGNFTKIISIRGGWSVDTRSYAPVGAFGHIGGDAQALMPYNQYKFDQRFPFGALLMGSGQGVLWIQNPVSFTNAFGAVDMRINDADNALGDNGGSLEVCFGN